MAMAACESIVDNCGIGQASKTLASVGDTGTIDGAATIENYSCSHLVKTTCGTPVFKHTGSLDNTKIEIQYIEYTDDSRLTMDSVYTDYPSKSINFNSISCPAGCTEPYLLPRVFETVSYTAAEIFEEFTAYRTITQTYLDEAMLIEEENSKVREQNFFEKIFGI